MHKSYMHVFPILTSTSHNSYMSFIDTAIKGEGIYLAENYVCVDCVQNGMSFNF